MSHQFQKNIKGLLLFGTLISSACRGNTDEPWSEDAFRDGESTTYSVEHPAEEQEDPDDEADPAGLAVIDGQIALSPEIFGEPLLLTAAFETGSSLDDANAMRSRIVYFEEEGEFILLREIQGGLVNSPVDRTLATFTPTEVGNDVLIDFNEGMNNVYLEFSVYQGWDPLDEFILPVVEGSIDEIAEDDGLVTIRHAVTALFGPLPIDALFYYGLSKYKPDPEFVPRTNSSVEGSYVNAPTAAGTIYAHRVGREAVVFYLAEDFPKARKKDVKASVKYWNKALAEAGVDLTIELDELPEGVRAFDPGYNVIDFIEDPTAGAARANNNTDPLTGEILKSTIQVSSLFGAGAIGVIETLWGMDVLEHLEQGPPVLTVPPEVLKRAISDYYIYSFTHELGHALGFRHNFASSLESTMDERATRATVTAYLQGEFPEGLSPAGSLMEYLETPLALLLGAHVRDKREPLNFDLQSVQAMYGDGPSPEFDLACEAELDLFFVDCAEFDAGANPIVGVYGQWEETIDAYAYRIAKALDAHAGEPIELSLPPDEVALVLLDPLQRLAEMLTVDANYLALAYLAEASIEDYLAAVRQYQQTSFAVLDGPQVCVPTHMVLGQLTQGLADHFIAQLRAQVEDNLAKLGTTLDPTVACPYFDALAEEIGTRWEPLNSLTYAPGLVQ